MQKRKYLVVLANNFARHVIRHFLQTSDSNVVALDFTDRNGIRPLLLTHGLMGCGEIVGRRVLWVGILE